MEILWHVSLLMQGIAHFHLLASLWTMELFGFISLCARQSVVTSLLWLNTDEIIEIRDESSAASLKLI
jgi:hypothetical protein